MVPPFGFDSLLRDQPSAPVTPSIASVPTEVAKPKRELVPPALPAPAPARPRSERPRSERRRPTNWRRRILVVVGILIVVLAFVGFRVSQPIPAAVVTAAQGKTVTIPPGTLTLPWAPMGQSAAVVPALGIEVTNGPQTSVPVASLTKMMTAYIILHDHPLSTGQNGPNITITQADVDYFNTDTVTDQANAQVTVGEVLTERQLLGGLLVHSANNYALTLARWDAGSLAAFVAKMNATAHSLGMDHTHYADPSGYDQGSQSTAGDLLKVAAPDMSIATFASIVRMPSITLPVAGTLSTYTPLLGIQGVIGVKSGFTTVAGGCDVLATYRTVDGKSVLILTAVTGQSGVNVLVAAGLQALNLANVAGTSIGTTPVDPSGAMVAHVAAAGHTVGAVTTAPISVLSWPGDVIKRVYQPAGTVKPGARQGTVIGHEVVTVGTQRVVVPVRLQKDLPQESLIQRIF